MSDCMLIIMKSFTEDIILKVFEWKTENSVMSHQLILKLMLFTMTFLVIREKKGAVTEKEIMK